MGFEPTTPGITIRCSNQLSYTHQSLDCIAFYCVARPAGIEPATTGLEGRCSIRLSYGRPGRIVASKTFQRTRIGRGRGIRTPDILLPKQARYQTALYPADVNGSTRSSAARLRNERLVIVRSGLQRVNAKTHGETAHIPTSQRAAARLGPLQASVSAARYRGAARAAMALANDSVLPAPPRSGVRESRASRVATIALRRRSAFCGWPR